MKATTNLARMALFLLLAVATFGTVGCDTTPADQIEEEIARLEADATTLERRLSEMDRLDAEIEQLHKDIAKRMGDKKKLLAENPEVAAKIVR